MNSSGSIDYGFRPFVCQSVYSGRGRSVGSLSGHVPYRSRGDNILSDVVFLSSICVVSLCPDELHERRPEGNGVNAGS